MQYQISMPASRAVHKHGRALEREIPRAETCEKRSYPFRILSVILGIGILIELFCLIKVPDYSNELEAARTAYMAALEQNRELTAKLDEAQSLDKQEQLARDDGYSYYGETIYIPVFEKPEVTK